MSAKKFLYHFELIMFVILICRLFHVIVDSDKTAAQILSIMNKHKLPGEVTFMPLNKLLSKEQQYPNSPVSHSFNIAVFYLTMESFFYDKHQGWVA